MYKSVDALDENMSDDEGPGGEKRAEKCFVVDPKMRSPGVVAVDHLEFICFEYYFYTLLAMDYDGL